MLKEPKLFFDSVGKGILGPSLDQGEVDGCNAILAAMEGSPLAWAAYALATAYHETASTMQPIKEFGGPTYFTRMYDPLGARPKLSKANGNIHPGDGKKFFGRGYVQLTWRSNYEKAGKKLGIDLVNNPDLALDPKVAAKIMRQGMTDGWFTGKSFSSYLPVKVMADRAAFTKARRIINGTDKADKIAGHAMDFQHALKVGGWS